MDFAAACMEIVDSTTVQIAEGDTGNTHASGFGGQKERLTKNLSRILDRNAIEIFVQGADQNGMPEVIDSALRLAVTFQPVGEILLSILGDAGEKRGHAAGNGELVCDRKCGRAEKGQRRVQRGGQE